MLADLVKIPDASSYTSAPKPDSLEMLAKRARMSND